MKLSRPLGQLNGLLLGTVLLLLLAGAFSPTGVSARGNHELTGVVESIGEETWTIGGVTFLVNADTMLDRGLDLGVTAEVEFQVLPDGSRLATEIETKAPDTIVNVIVLPDGTMVAEPIEFDEPN